MVDKVDPSIASDGQAYMVAQTIKQHGAVGDGWVVPSGTDVVAGHSNSGLSGAPLDGFEYAPGSTSGLDPVFASGEAFIGGSWVARDTTTTYASLADDTTGQTVYVGWDYNAADTVKIGLAADFDSRDEKVELWEFDTAGGSITSDTDKRTVNKTLNLGAPKLDAGSELKRFLMTAVSSATQGTAGDSSNELWRAGSDVSDLLMSVRGAGTDRMNLVWNAYYDGSTWRYIVGSEPAHRLAFAGNGDVLVYSTQAGSADGAITWEGWKFGNLGAIFNADGTQLFRVSDQSVPQSTLAGPPGSLSAYPLEPADISDGAGSGLDADLLDGKHASEIGGGGPWTQVATLSDSDTGPMDLDTGTLSTTYDQYRIYLYWENNTGTNQAANMRINGIGTTVYDTGYVNTTTGSVDSTKQNEVRFLANTNSNSFASCTIILTSRQTTLGSTGDRWPKYSVTQQGDPDLPQALWGEVEQDVTTIDRIHIYETASDAQGKARVEGRDI